MIFDYRGFEAKKPKTYEKFSLTGRVTIYGKYLLIFHCILEYFIFLVYFFIGQILSVVP